MDISQLSLPELRRLAQQLALETRRREQQDMQRAREQILSIAHSAGIPLKDLIGLVPRHTGSRPNPSKGSKVAPKYRHPQSAAVTWTGRGRKPAWIENFLAKGHQLEEFLITPEAGEKTGTAPQTEAAGGAN